jgi:hypothetical protein
LREIAASMLAEASFMELLRACHYGNNHPHVLYRLL